MATYPATNSKEASELLIDGSNQVHEIVNGDATTEVVTESGPVPSVRKALADTFLFQDPITWNQESDETAFNQLRTFDGNIYWAPTAATLNPIPMGSTPIGDGNWKLAPVDVSREWTLQELTRSQNEVIGGKIFPLDGSVLQNGDVVPTGTTHLRVDIGGNPTIVAMSPIASGFVSSLVNNKATVGGVEIEFKNPTSSRSPNNVKVSNFSNFREAVEFNSNSGSLTVIIDQDTTIDSEFTYNGDITITGSGVIELSSGVNIGMNHVGGSLRCSVNVEFTTEDKTSTTNIIAIKSTDFQEVKVSSVLNRVCLRALNDISNVKGNVYFDGLMKGDYSAIPEGINDAVILVEAANLFDVSGCVNESVGCERLFKSSHSVRTFKGLHGQYRGSTKRQVIDTYINTKKVIFRENDVKMDSFLTLVEGKLKTEVDLPGVVPEQVLIDISDNVIEIPDDTCNRIVLFQAPGGSNIEPTSYQYESAIKFNENIVRGRTLSSIIDARGFTNYEEKGGTYKNGELDRQTANIVACENIEIEDINADSYAAYISGTGSSQGGQSYNRSPKRIELKSIGKTYKFNGFIFIDECQSLSKLTINKSNAKERITSEPSTGFVYVRDSAIEYLTMTKNNLERNTSIPLRLENSTVSEKEISGNNWQIDKGDFLGGLVVNGSSITIVTGIDGNIVPSESRFSVDISENLQGCTISAYKSGVNVIIEIFNNTGSDKTLSPGKYYISCEE